MDDKIGFIQNSEINKTCNIKLQVSLQGECFQLSLVLIALITHDVNMQCFKILFFNKLTGYCMPFRCLDT
jgi:hypothetical protein